jgi:hypothetical protein
MQSGSSEEQEMVTALMLHEQAMMREIMYPMLERMALQDHLLPVLRDMINDLRMVHGVVI